MSTGIFNQYTGYHNRRSIRLRGYDYSRNGAYFVTICIRDRTQRFFGDMVNGKMVLNNFGKCAIEEWKKTAVYRPYVELDDFVVMPNHIHGIIRLVHRRVTACRDHDATAPCGDHDDEITEEVTARRDPTETHNATVERFGKPTTASIPTIVRAFKSAVSKRIHEIDTKFKWQRNYFEHIIRDEKSLLFIKQYIRNNPLNWDGIFEGHPDLFFPPPQA